MHRPLYLTMAGVALIGVGMLAGGALDAVADEQNRVFPISWWKAHPASVRAILPRCHDDVQAARSANCINAEAAAAGLRAQDGPDIARMLNEPTYWAAMPLAREAFLAQCRNGTAMVPRACPAAAQAAAAEIQRR